MGLTLDYFTLLTMDTIMNNILIKRLAKSNLTPTKAWSTFEVTRVADEEHIIKARLTLIDIVRSNKPNEYKVKCTTRLEELERLYKESLVKQPTKYDPTELANMIEELS